MSATITWLGHSAVRLTLTDGRVVLIDPWLTGNPACPPHLREPHRCDLIVLTHGHADHVGDTAALIKKFDPPVAANYDLCCAMERAFGRGQYRGMNTGGTQECAGVRVSLTRAYHSSALETKTGAVYAGMPNGAVIAAPDLATVYHAGDTDVFSDMTLIARLLAPKIAMLPIGDLYTMGAAGAALAAEFLQPAAILPLHYKTFPALAPTADAFRAALAPQLKERLFAPAVGQELIWTQTGIGR